MMKQLAPDSPAEWVAGLYADHHARILRQTRGNTVLAEDLAPEMLLAAMRYAPTYRGTGTMGSWLTKIAQRQLHEHARSNPRGREVFAEDVSIHADALAGLEEQFVAEQLAAEAAQRIEACLAQLPEVEAECIRLRMLRD